MMFPERIKPQIGQESVWDYPRPPRIEISSKRVQVVFNDVIIADTQRSKRVLETSHPPVYYIPPEDVEQIYLQKSSHRTYCEWKGIANYYNISVEGEQSMNAAWYYANPTPYFAALKDHLAFYPSRVDACYINGEQVKAQPGDFYGGWITKDIVGPFKGDLGTSGW
ncbi:MAG: DUF427 domain-containing protein [Snowella sp.]|nr:DUF427 domain-containing protein [Snowella sp.]